MFLLEGDCFMQMETEITVLVKTDYETLKKELIKNGLAQGEPLVLC